MLLVSGAALQKWDVFSDERFKLQAQNEIAALRAQADREQAAYEQEIKEACNFLVISLWSMHALFLRPARACPLPRQRFAWA